MAPGTTSDMRNGMVMRYSGDLYQVVEWQHINPGKGRAFVRVKLKGLTNGSVIEERLRSGEAIDIVRIESRPMQFLYRDGDTLVFMDNETFEQLKVTNRELQKALRLISDNPSQILLSEPPPED